MDVTLSVWTALLHLRRALRPADYQANAGLDDVTALRAMEEALPDHVGAKGTIRHRHGLRPPRACHTQYE